VGVKINVKMRVFKRRGLDQIRTDVDGFADHCLATRPRDLLKEKQKYNFQSNKQFILLLVLIHSQHLHQLEDLSF
jgi:hypothetical protein